LTIKKVNFIYSSYFLKEMRRNHLFVFSSVFIWNYYAYDLSSCDCAEVWWQRKMELAFVEGEEGVERS